MKWSKRIKASDQMLQLSARSSAHTMCVRQCRLAERMHVTRSATRSTSAGATNERRSMATTRGESALRGACASEMAGKSTAKKMMRRASRGRFVYVTCRA